MAVSSHVSTQVSFLGTGDVGPVHGPKDGFPITRYTELVRPTLAAVDLRFGNCERQYSARGTPSERSLSCAQKWIRGARSWLMPKSPGLSWREEFGRRNGDWLKPGT